MAFLWLQKKLNEQLTISILSISGGFQAADGEQEVLFRHTYGMDVAYTPGKLQVQTPLYHQSGKDVSRKNISAYMGTLELS